MRLELLETTINESTRGAPFWMKPDIDAGVVTDIISSSGSYYLVRTDNESAPIQVFSERYSEIGSLEYDNSNSSLQLVLNSTVSIDTATANKIKEMAEAYIELNHSLSSI